MFPQWLAKYLLCDKDFDSECKFFGLWNKLRMNSLFWKTDASTSMYGIISGFIQNSDPSALLILARIDSFPTSS